VRDKAGESLDELTIYEHVLDRYLLWGLVFWGYRLKRARLVKKEGEHLGGARTRGCDTLTNHSERGWPGLMINNGVWWLLVFNVG